MFMLYMLDHVCAPDATELTATQKPRQTPGSSSLYTMLVVGREVQDAIRHVKRTHTDDRNT